MLRSDIPEAADTSICTSVTRMARILPSPAAHPSHLALLGDEKLLTPASTWTQLPTMGRSRGCGIGNNMM
jgi:hypothetical protein